MPIAQQLKSFGPRAAVFICFFAFSGCVISSYDISADLREVFPLDTGDYRGVNSNSITKIIRTTDGYEYFEVDKYEISNLQTVHLYKISDYDGYIAKLIYDSSRYAYSFAQKTENGFQVFPGPSALGGKQIASANYLGNLVTKGEIHLVYGIINLELDRSASHTLSILREIARRKIDLGDGLRYVAVSPFSDAIKDLLARSDSDCDSFDSIRLAVCKQPSLKSQDIAMVSAYAQVAQTLSSQQLQNLRANQKAWHLRAAACAENSDVAGCLARAYNDRTAEIQAQLPKTSVAAGRYEKIVNPNPAPSWRQKFVSGAAPAKSIAVIIGISNYTGGYPALRTASADAQKMAQFLLQDAGFDVVYVVTDNSATKEAIDRLMTNEIPQVVGRFDRFVFYWSGHGDQMTSGEQAFGFLPLATSKPRDFASMVSMEDLARWDRYLQSQQALFILDACLSGLAGVETKGARDVLLEQLSQSSHTLVTAGTGTEIVISSSRWTGSLFTESFIRGAKGEARRAFDVVTLYSLMDYVKQQIAIEQSAVNFNGGLTPQMRALRAGNGEFFFTPSKSQ